MLENTELTRGWAIEEPWFGSL